MARLLVVEGENSERESLVSVLRQERHEVVAADSPQQAVRYLSEPIDVMISDVKLAHAQGAELLEHWKSRQPRLPLLLTASNGDSRSAVEAMKLGAEEYLSKPVDPDELLLLVSRCIEGRNKDARIAELTRRLDKQRGFERIVGKSKAICEAVDQARRAAEIDGPVLIVGEPGAGKELVAETIHQNSARKQNPFLVIHTAGAEPYAIESELFGAAPGAMSTALELRDGRLQAAQGGTVLIDEVGELPPQCQARLAALLGGGIAGNGAQRRLDVRIIAATCRHLPQMVERGEFREDLYHQLSALTVRLPALRERRDDVPLLIGRFLHELDGENGRPPRGLDRELKNFLQQHDWPGNVRQLRNCLQSMIVLARDETLRMDDLPAWIGNGNSSSAPSAVSDTAKLKDLQRAAIEQALARHGGNRTHAAAALGISVRTLQRKLKAWGNGEHANGQ